jgi:hypothetical protein
MKGKMVRRFFIPLARGGLNASALADSDQGGKPFALSQLL